jgi:hypothetical protein
MRNSKEDFDGAYQKRAECWKNLSLLVMDMPKKLQNMFFHYFYHFHFTYIFFLNCF